MLSDGDLRDLRRAYHLLERPSLAARVCDLAGAPAEELLRRLPESVQGAVQPAARKALETALGVALLTLDDTRPRPQEALHKVCAWAAGGLGGFFGGVALLVELPVTTGIMLRSIAAIARSEGEDLRLVDAQLACLEVLALGGRTEADDAAETGYYAVRAVLAKSVNDAARHLARAGLPALADKSAPALARFMSALAARFGVVVSQKAAAQLVPLVGAVGGAMVNAMFMDHFQQMARGHFILRRLERANGREAVQRAYEALRPAGRAAA